MSNKVPNVSIVFPVYNEEGNLDALYNSVKQACVQANIAYEMIFVDDGSTDNSLNIIKNLRSQDAEVIYISLSRNFGHQNAIFAGMSYCRGDAVITMDADLQHPPSLIARMIDLWQGGTEIVYTVKRRVRLTFTKYIIMKIFYWFISEISGMQFNFGQSDFRLIDKKVLRAILQIPEYHKFLRGQVRWVGFRQEGLVYDVEERYSGKPKYSYRSLFSLALDGIFAFSRYPLHLITWLGVVISGISFFYILSVLIIWLLKKMNLAPTITLLPGWATLAIGIFFLGSLQLIAIGILGEYLGRVYDQTKGRPVFIVREMAGV